MNIDVNIWKSFFSPGRKAKVMKLKLSILKMLFNQFLVTFTVICLIFSLVVLLLNQSPQEKPLVFLIAVLAIVLGSTQSVSDSTSAIKENFGRWPCITFIHMASAGEQSLGVKMCPQPLSYHSLCL